MERLEERVKQLEDDIAYRNEDIDVLEYKVEKLEETEFYSRNIYLQF